MKDDEQKIERHSADALEGDTGRSQATGDQPLSGAWADLDWNDMVDELERIRHESKPTPPIDEL
jgi:hypothetical protein